MAPLLSASLAEIVTNAAPIDSSETTEGRAGIQTFPLRRAVYVRVSDLAKTYNIDLGKLKEELEKARYNAKCESRSKLESSAAGQPVDDLELVTKSELFLKDSGRRVLTEKSLQQRLQPPNVGFNLCLLVGKVEIVVDKFRVDRSHVRLAEVEVGDETGIVSLRARDEQIDMMEEISEQSGAIVLRNCTIELYQGRHLRLAVTKWGKLSSYPDSIASTPSPPAFINREIDFSLVDLTVVAGDIYDAEKDPSLLRLKSQHHDNGSCEIRTYPTAGVKQQQPLNIHQTFKKGGRDKRYIRQGVGSTFTHSSYQDTMGGTHMNSGMSGLSAYPPLYSDGSAAYAYHSTLQHGGRHHMQSTNQQQVDLPTQQQLFLLHQYEIRQRQLEQMQLYQHQQERHRLMFDPHHHGRQFYSSASQPTRSGSVDSSGDFSAPMRTNFALNLHTGSHGMKSQSHTGGLLQMHSTRQEQHYHSEDPGLNYQSDAAAKGSGSLSRQGYVLSHDDTRESTKLTMDAPSVHQVSHDEPRYMPQFTQQHRVTYWGNSEFTPNQQSSGSIMDTPPNSPGRMNPQASSFAPSFATVTMHNYHQVPNHMQSYIPYSPNHESIYGSHAPSQSQHQCAYERTQASFDAAGDANDTSYHQRRNAAFAASKDHQSSHTSDSNSPILGAVNPTDIK